MNYTNDGEVSRPLSHINTINGFHPPNRPPHPTTPHKFGKTRTRREFIVRPLVGVVTGIGIVFALNMKALIGTVDLI